MSQSPTRPNNGYPETMTSTTVFMTKDLHQRLRIQAAKEGVKMAEIIRSAIEAELIKRGG